jgi:hypothetical protein
MRLLDRVVSQQDFQIQHESLGKAFLVQTAANFKSKLQNTVHRFVLDAPATAFCTDFAVLEAKTLSESIDLLRLPAEVFWIEWMDRARVEALGSPQTPARALWSNSSPVNAGVWRGFSQDMKRTPTYVRSTSNSILISQGPRHRQGHT